MQKENLQVGLKLIVVPVASFVMLGQLVQLAGSFAEEEGNHPVHIPLAFVLLLCCCIQEISGVK